MRIVEGVRGRVAMRMRAVDRASDYGVDRALGRAASDDALRRDRRAGRVPALHAACRLRGEDVNDRRRVRRVEGASGSPSRSPGTSRYEAAADRSRIRRGAGTHRDLVERVERRGARSRRARSATRSLRSLITLKALTYEPTGGIVAAPTTSLPEEIGGVRNWDYRYCWLRDATLDARGADPRAGYTEEAQAWRDWLLRAGRRRSRDRSRSCTGSAASGG